MRLGFGVLHRAFALQRHLGGTVWLGIHGRCYCGHRLHERAVFSGGGEPLYLCMVSGRATIFNVPGYEWKVQTPRASYVKKYLADLHSVQKIADF